MAQKRCIKPSAGNDYSQMAYRGSHYIPPGLASLFCFPQAITSGPDSLDRAAHCRVSRNQRTGLRPHSPPPVSAPAPAPSNHTHRHHRHHRRPGGPDEPLDVHESESRHSSVARRLESTRGLLLLLLLLLLRLLLLRVSRPPPLSFETYDLARSINPFSAARFLRRPRPAIPALPRPPRSSPSSHFPLGEHVALIIFMQCRLWIRAFTRRRASTAPGLQRIRDRVAFNAAPTLATRTPTFPHFFRPYSRAELAARLGAMYFDVSTSRSRTGCSALHFFSYLLIYTMLAIYTLLNIHNYAPGLIASFQYRLIDRKCYMHLYIHVHVYTHRP
jgi:hypothetical protein